MVTVTRLDGSVIILNGDLIETIEAVPETVVTLTTHKKVVVREAVSEVVARAIAYQRAVRCGGTTQTSVQTAAPGTVA